MMTAKAADLLCKFIEAKNSAFDTSNVQKAKLKFLDQTLRDYEQFTDLCQKLEKLLVSISEDLKDRDS